MADFSQDKKYNYNWQSSKFKNLALSGSYISQFINDAGYVTSSVAISASYALTASYLTGTIASASYAISASHALTASYFAGTVTSASYATQALSASYALNGGVTQLLAGPNVTLSPTNGLGQVTVSATLSGSTIFNTATGSYGSFYDTTTQTNPIANVARSMSFNSTDITNGVSISGSISPFNTYVKTTNAGIYNIQFSAQVDKTDGGTDDIVIWLRKNEIDLTDTATTLTLPTNNSKVVAAWNWFVSSAAGDYYQIIWRSADTDLRLLAEPISVDHPGIPSVILTVNRVDQFLSNTGSFSGSFTGTFTGSLLGTASYATTALSASYAPSTPAFPYTGSALITGSLGVTGSASIFAFTGSTATIFNIRNSANTLDIIKANGRGDVFIGQGAGRLTTGVSNTFMGLNAGYANITGQENTAIGAGAGQSSLGSFNTYLGTGAGQNGTTTEGSTFIGYYAGQNSNAGYAVLIGYTAGTTAGNGSIAIGYNAGPGTGTHNLSIGQSAGVGMTTGAINMHLGYRTVGSGVTTGNYNTLVGGNIVVGNVSNNAVLADMQGNIAIRKDSNHYVGIGYTGSATLGAKLDIKAQGALSTDIALRVRNSVENDDILKVMGNMSMNLLGSSTGGYLNLSRTTGGVVKLMHRATATLPSQFLISSYGDGGSIGQIVFDTVFGNDSAPNFTMQRFISGLSNLTGSALYTPFGSNAATFVMKNALNYAGYGIVPTGTATDHFAMYSADANGTAGAASPHFRTEDGSVIWLGTNSKLFNLTLSGSTLITGSLGVTGSITVGNITSTSSTENTLNVYPPPAGGVGEGGQILLAASGGLYTSASMLDTWQNYFRILRGTNTGGSTAQLVGLDLQTGNLSVAGAVIPSAWSSGQVIKDTMLSNTEVTVSTTTIATSGTDTDFVTYNYTPVSSNSYLVIHYHLSSYDFSSGTGNDSYISRIKVDGSEITYSTQSTVNGNRTGVLFPLTGRYTNSNTTAKSIVIACRRNSADDSITIVNSSTSMWLRITEIAI